jgi:hypothetical protein
MEGNQMYFIFSPKKAKTAAKPAPPRPDTRPKETVAPSVTPAAQENAPAQDTAAQDTNVESV